jgi:aldehyde dehydrogenase (NAD(P)+)
VAVDTLLCLLQAFAPFVQRGFLEFVYGGADVGAYCCQHELVAAVHLTGSEATYNNIMFGSPQVITVNNEAHRVALACGTL